MVMYHTLADLNSHNFLLHNHKVFELVRTYLNNTYEIKTENISYSQQMFIKIWMDLSL